METRHRADLEWREEFIPTLRQSFDARAADDTQHRLRGALTLFEGKLQLLMANPRVLFGAPHKVAERLQVFAATIAARSLGADPTCFDSTRLDQEPSSLSDFGRAM